MADALIDANIFMYAAGGPHPYRDPCRELVRGLGTGTVRGHRALVDAELFQELAYRYASIGRSEVGWELQRSLLALSLPILAVDGQVIQAFLRHQSTYAALVRSRAVAMRDLLHLAVATRHGVTVVVSADRDLDRFAEVQRLDPLSGGGPTRTG